MSVIAKSFIRLTRTFPHTAVSETPILVIVLPCLGAVLVVILLAAFVRSKAKKKITVVSEITNELEMDVQLPKDDNSEPLEAGACDWISCFLTHVEPINFPLQVDKWLFIRLRPRPHKRVFV